MALNPVQQRALNHLSDPSGSGHRQSALNDLIQAGFFTPTDSEVASQEKLAEFIEAEYDRGRFCEEGISRFAEAVLPSDEEGTTPAEGEYFVTFKVKVAHPWVAMESPEHEDLFVDNVLGRIAKVIQLTRSPRVVGTPALEPAEWEVISAEYYDWRGV